MVAKAAGFSHVAPPDDLAPILKEAAEKLDAESFNKLDQLLSAAETRIAKGGLFAEMGSSRTGETTTSDDPWTQIVQKADALVEKSDSPLTQDQAIDRVLKTAEGEKLYAEYQARTYHFGAANIGGGVS